MQVIKWVSQYILYLQLKQFQKSGKNSPKHCDSKDSKKNKSSKDSSALKESAHSDTHVIDTTNTAHSDLIDTTNPHSDTVVEAEVVNCVIVTETDTTYPPEPDQGVPNNQVIQETDKDSAVHSLQDNNTVEKTDKQQTGFPQVSH